MYNNNLILDYEKKINIPQNSNSFYIINKSLLIKNCIEIEISHKENFDISNLYAIIKSYTNNLIYLPANVFTLIKNNDNSFIASNFNTNEIKDLSFFAFSKLINFQFKKDWEYIKRDGSYYILISYPIEIFDINLLKFIKPIYPWNEKISRNLKINTIEEDLISLINKKEDKIKELEYEIKKLKKRNRSRLIWKKK
jgi:hypothetical protein